MALPEILAAIRAEGDAEVAQIEGVAAGERAAVERAAEERAQRVRAEAAASLQRKSEREMGERLAAARAEAGRELRGGREALFQRALGELRARLEGARSGPQWPALVAALLDEGLGAMPDMCELRVDERDAEVVGQLLRERGVSGVQLAADGQTWGGVVLGSGDGRSLDNRLEVRLERAEPLLREVFGRRLAALEGDGEG